MTDAKTRVTPEEALEKVRACIGALPHGYRITESKGWLRVMKFRGADRWDRPGIDFRLDLPKKAGDRRSPTTKALLLEIRIQIDLPTFLESNILVTQLRSDLELYSRLWFTVGELAKTLEITP